MLRVRSARGLAVAGVVGTILGVVPASPAAAHGDLVRSEPAEGATVTSQPDTVRLEFSRAVYAEPGAVVLRTADGEEPLAAHHEAAGDTVLVATLPAGLADGPLEVRWHGTSADGHAVDGSVRFGLNAPPVARATADRATDLGRVRAAMTITRLLAYLATAVLVGGWMFLAVVWPSGATVPRTRQLLAGVAAIGVVVCIAWIALQGAVTRRSSAALWSPGIWLDIVRSPAGRGWVARGLLFVLATPLLALLRRDEIKALRSPAWLAGAAAVGVGLLRVPGFSSHAGEGDHPLLGLSADLVHLGAVAVWFGGLVLLVTVVLPRRQTAELAAVLPRFSRLAMVSVATLVGAGVVLAWLVVGDVGDLTGTRFGRLLGLKLGVFALLLGAAEMSRRWIGRRLPRLLETDGTAAALRPIALSVTAEFTLAVAVLAVASSLVATNPGG